MSQLKVRSLPALSASMPMWDVLQLFKIGRAHMAVLCEAPEGSAQSPYADSAERMPVEASCDFNRAAADCTSPKGSARRVMRLTVSWQCVNRPCDRVDAERHSSVLWRGPADTPGGARAENHRGGRFCCFWESPACAWLSCALVS